MAITPDPSSTERTIEKVSIVATSRPEVFHALTTNEGAQTFFARHTNIELRRGGPYEIYFDHGGEHGSRGSEGCRVLSHVVDRMVSFTWNAPPQFEDVRWQRTFVVIQLEDAPAGATQVRLTHSGWKTGGQWDEVYDYFDAAWGHVLTNLERRFTEGPLWESTGQPEAVEMSHWVYYIHPARDDFHDAPTDEENRLVSEHARYVRGLLGQGRIVLAGPSFDPTMLPDTSPEAVPFGIPPPGIVIFTARDEADAKQTLEADPAVRAGVFKGQVNPFVLAYMNDMGK